MLKVKRLRLNLSIGNTTLSFKRNIFVSFPCDPGKTRVLRKCRHTIKHDACYYVLLDSSVIFMGVFHHEGRNPRQRHI